MNYVVLEMKWVAGMCGSELTYVISEIVAIRLDEKLHTKETFRFIEENEHGYAAAEQHFAGEGKIIVTDMSSGWKAFAEWLDKNDMIVIWNTEQTAVMRYANNITNMKKVNKLFRKIVDIKKLYIYMTDLNKERDLSLKTAMKEMELVCDTYSYGSPLYNAQCLVRFYRKLFKSGYEILGARFVHGLIDNDYFYISLHTYFPKLEERRIKQRNKIIGDILKTQGMKEYAIDGNVVTIHTELASWRFNVERNMGTLRYNTYDLYKGERELCVKIKKDMGWDERLGIVCDAVRGKEERLRYGVGGEEMRKVVKVLIEKLNLLFL